MEKMKGSTNAHRRNSKISHEAVRIFRNEAERQGIESELLTREAAEQLTMGESGRVAEKKAAQVAGKDVKRVVLRSRN